MCKCEGRRILEIYFIRKKFACFRKEKDGEISSLNTTIQEKDGKISELEEEKIRILKNARQSKCR